MDTGELEDRLLILAEQVRDLAEMAKVSFPCYKYGNGPCYRLVHHIEQAASSIYLASLYLGTWENKP